MILLVLMCLLSEIIAYQAYENFFDGNFNQRSRNDHLYNDNFSEDEINAINEYKRERDFRTSTRNKVFEPQFENRRFFDWLKPQKKKEEPKKVTYEDLVNNKLYYLRLTRNLTDNLSRLTNVLDKFTLALIESPIINPTIRRTRSINNSEIGEVTNTKNKTTDNVAVTKNAETTEKINGRRMLSSYDFKQKMISSINNTLNILLHNFKTASNAQQVFGKNLLFNIGFKSGSVITLKAYMQELQNIFTKNETIMKQNDILQMYDTVNKVNKVSGKLLDELNFLIYQATIVYKN